MAADETSRRKFVLNSATGISAAWLSANWGAIAQAQERAAAGGNFTYFNKRQAADIDAMSAQIFPTTDTPGAREAQVVYFIDVALTTFAADQQEVYAKGFADLSARIAQAAPKAASFAALAQDQQIALLTAIETTPFFRAVRNHTIMGMFAAPQHGGNFNKVGWKLIGYDDSLNFRVPFGAYDA